MTFLKIFSQVLLFFFFPWESFASSAVSKSNNLRGEHHPTGHSWTDAICDEGAGITWRWFGVDLIEPTQRCSYISRANTVVLLWLNQLTILVSQPHFCLCGHDVMCPVKIKVDKCYRNRSVSLNFSGQRSAAVQAWSPGVKTWTSALRFGTPRGHFLLLFVGFVMFLTYHPYWSITERWTLDTLMSWLDGCFFGILRRTEFERMQFVTIFLFSIFLTVLCDIVSLNFFQCRVLNKLYVKSCSYFLHLLPWSCWVFFSLFSRLNFKTPIQLTTEFKSCRRPF